MNILGGGNGWKVRFIEPHINRRKGANCRVDLWEYGNEIRDSRLAGLIYRCKFLAAHQICSTYFWGSNKTTAKRRLDILANSRYLLRHEILHADGSLHLPFYSIGPAAFISDLEGADYDMNFLQYSIIDVLKILSVNQLFMNLTRSAFVKINYNTVPPFTAEISMISKKYGRLEGYEDKTVAFKVISIRNFDSDFEYIKENLVECRNERLMVIACDKRTMKRFMPFAPPDCKLTYDDELLLEKISSNI